MEIYNMQITAIISWILRDNEHENHHKRTFHGLKGLALFLEDILIFSGFSGLLGDCRTKTALIP